MFSYFFKDYGNAQAGYYFFTFVSGGLVPIIILVLRFIGGTASRVGNILKWIFRLLPSFSFGEILLNLGSIPLLSLAELDFGTTYGPWDFMISLYPIFYLAG
jgi:ATP-binding cassette subfamily A (ABC1) protein 3